MDKYNVSWMNYYSDLPSSAYLRPYLSSHLAPVAQFASDVAAGHLADVTYIDTNFGILDASKESNEAPHNNIRRGEYFVVQNVATMGETQDSHPRSGSISSMPTMVTVRSAPDFENEGHSPIFDDPDAIAQYTESMRSLAYDPATTIPAR